MNNEEKILELLGQLTSDVAGMKTEMTGIKTEMTSMKTEMTSMKTEMADMKENMAEMQTTLTKVAVTQENIVLPRLQALAEGQQNLLDTLAPKNRVEALEEEVDLLKTVIRALSADVQELKKAQ